MCASTPNTAASAGGPAAPDGAPALDIAVGVLAADGHWLIARRRRGTPGAGYWEFPGGKAHPGEAPADCLARELNEELGIEVVASAPLICFVHARGPEPVRLHVRRVTRWRGVPAGCEGQRLAWLAPADAPSSALLPATDVILNALTLPPYYSITPPVGAAGIATWLAALDNTLAAGVRLLRVRDHALGQHDYAHLAAVAVARAHAAGARVLLDRDAAMVERLGADGLHWPGARIAGGAGRPVASERLFAVSAHTHGDLERAVAAGADFATLSPVAPTPSHPGERALGWPGWARRRGELGLCVYALGGLGSDDRAAASAANAQGVAAIRAFWRG